MNNEWARQKLEEYLNYLNAYINHPQEEGRRPDNSTRAKLRAREPTAKEILRNLRPEFGNFDFEEPGGEELARNSVIRGLGILQDRDEWAINLAPEGPSLNAARLHRWVWDSALTLWESQHYRQAVHAAATAINAHTQNKLGRRDVSDDRLMQEAFSPHKPEPGKPRLRCPGDPTDQTTQSCQRVCPAICGRLLPSHS